MLLTRASEYALLSLTIIGESSKPIGVQELSTQLSIPKSFLAKILQKLAKNGLLESKKGVNGGFILNKDPNDISMYSIISISEGKSPAIFDCTHYSDTCPNGVIGSCAISPFLSRFQIEIDTFLNKLTLGDILK